ncbi:MAG: hypothetical protein M1817_001486 [Caeruleum heppii]|nr:MAG: hypothetical protein M1817_001486 [Caeruleum heppii]
MPRLLTALVSPPRVVDLKIPLLSKLVERLSRNFDFSRILMVVLMIPVLLLALALGSSTSSGTAIPSIYLVSFHQGPLQTRVGFYGVCAAVDGGPWRCNTDGTELQRLAPQNEELGAILKMATSMKDVLAFPHLLYVATPSPFPISETGSEREVKPFPSKVALQTALAAAFISSMLVLVSLLWHRVVMNAARNISSDVNGGAVQIDAGTRLMTLSGLAFAALIIVTLVLLLVHITIEIASSIISDD